MFFLPGKLSGQQDIWLWSSQQNIHIKMCMKNVCPKKMVPNIPVLASLCFMRSFYHTQYSASQELFVKFMAMWCWKCYNIENIYKILRRMKVNGGDFILRWHSSGISLQNTSPVEKFEDNLMLTWNSGDM